MVIRMGYGGQIPAGSYRTRRPGNETNGSKMRNNHSQPRWCADQSPYPEVKVESPNRFYARLLMEDHAGYVSETSAITQYLYHHHVLEEKYPDVSDLLECITLVEMTHMELLAEAIIKLGGKPKFGVKRGRDIGWWRGDFVYYGYDLCDMLAADIQGEKDAIVQYQKHINMIDDQYLRALIARIIKDEKEHIKYLTEKMNQYCRKK